MHRAKVEDWVEAARRKIWTLAGNISRRDDGRWSTLLLEWEPAGGKRRSGKPLKRWSEDLDRYMAEVCEEEERGAWRLFAEDRDEWKDMSNKFAVTAGHEEEEEDEAGEA